MNRYFNSIFYSLCNLSLILIPHALNLLSLEYVEQENEKRLFTCTSTTIHSLLNPAQPWKCFENKMKYNTTKKLTLYFIRSLVWHRPSRITSANVRWKTAKAEQETNSKWHSLKAPLLFAVGLYTGERSRSESNFMA